MEARLQGRVRGDRRRVEEKGRRCGRRGMIFGVVWGRGNCGRGV